MVYYDLSPIPHIWILRPKPWPSKGALATENLFGTESMSAGSSEIDEVPPIQHD